MIPLGPKPGPRGKGMLAIPSQMHRAILTLSLDKLRTIWYSKFSAELSQRVEMVVGRLCCIRIFISSELAAVCSLFSSSPGGPNPRISAEEALSFAANFLQKQLKQQRRRFPKGPASVRGDALGEVAHISHVTSSAGLRTFLLSNRDALRPDLDAA